MDTKTLSDRERGSRSNSARRRTSRIGLALGLGLGLGAGLGLAGCAGMNGGGLLAGGPSAGSGGGRSNYTCPGGTFFDTSYDASNTTMQLRVNGATSHPHTLNRIVSPSGQTLFQDAEYQLIPGASPSQVTLQARQGGQAPLVCSKLP